MTETTFYVYVLMKRCTSAVHNKCRSDCTGVQGKNPENDPSASTKAT